VTAKRKPSSLDKLKMSASDVASALADAAAEEEIRADDLEMVAERFANRLQLDDEQREEFMAIALRDAGDES
jgi:hypothetical protein